MSCSYLFNHFPQQVSNVRGQPGQVPDSQLSAGHFSLLSPDQRSQSAGDCAAAVITSVSVQLQSEAMQHFNEKSASAPFSSCVTWLSVWCAFPRVPAPHFILICIWRKRSIHRELQHLRQRGTLYMKVGRITYALGVSLKSPKHAYFPCFFPQNIVDRINYSFVNVYFASKTRMTRPLM